uniref:Uncharacterized protein n=1 Tax=Kwoniella bestiolae CBS 10118 TaxID=1296100 RepID=A0A1B9G0K8_9TREE|nr:hypothetical protein I302_06007 [Kwoniella bestiolae CBS 10118]OCF24546.1 hypothetical protein I302_06007 [Kwoniella bestiolae CBS 10118]
MGNSNSSTKPTTSVYQPYAPTNPYPSYIPPKKKNILDRLDDKLEQMGKHDKAKQDPMLVQPYVPSYGYPNPNPRQVGMSMNNHNGNGNGNGMHPCVSPSGGYPYANNRYGYGGQGYNYALSDEYGPLQYETARQKKKRKKQEKGEILGAIGELGGALASMGDGGHGDGGSSGDGGGGSSGGGGGSSG